MFVKRMDIVGWIVTVVVAILVLYLVVILILFFTKKGLFGPYDYPPPEPSKCPNSTNKSTWGTSACNAARING